MQSNEKAIKLANFLSGNVPICDVIAKPDERAFRIIYARVFSTGVEIPRVKYEEWLAKTGRLDSVLSCATKDGKILGQCDAVQSLDDYYSEMPNELIRLDILHYIHDHLEAEKDTAFTFAVDSTLDRIRELVYNFNH